MSSPNVPRPGLAAARQRAGFNQEAFAKEVGVTKHTVSQWETGATGINAKRRPLIARALGISLEELDHLLQPEHPTAQVLGLGRVTVAGRPAVLKLVQLPGSHPTVYVPGFVVSPEDDLVVSRLPRQGTHRARSRRPR